MRELPIKRPIACVAVKAHRYRIIVVCCHRRGDRMTASFVGGAVRSGFLLLGVADGTPLSAGFLAAVARPANASCVLVVGFEGPISLRMAFSVTPSAIARLL